MIALVLAGGRSSRLGGGDKGLLLVDGVPILRRVIAAVADRCGTVLLSANGDLDRFASFGRRVIADTVPGQLGPLAGLLAGMDHVAAAHPEADTILTVPGDAPFLPPDLVPRLEERRRETGATIVQACSGERTHAVVALWSMALRDDLRRALVDEGIRKVGLFAARHRRATVAWPTAPLDPFLNVNTPADLAEARAVLGRAP